MIFGVKNSHEWSEWVRTLVDTKYYCVYYSDIFEGGMVVHSDTHSSPLLIKSLSPRFSTCYVTVLNEVRVLGIGENGKNIEGRFKLKLK